MTIRPVSDQDQNLSNGPGPNTCKDQDPKASLVLNSNGPDGLIVFVARLLDLTGAWDVAVRSLTKASTTPESEAHFWSTSLEHLRPSGHLRHLFHILSFLLDALPYRLSCRLSNDLPAVMAGRNLRIQYGESYKKCAFSRMQLPVAFPNSIRSL